MKYRVFLSPAAEFAKGHHEQSASVCPVPGVPHSSLPEVADGISPVCGSREAEDLVAMELLYNSGCSSVVQSTVIPRQQCISAQKMYDNFLLSIISAPLQKFSSLNLT